MPKSSDKSFVHKLTGAIARNNSLLCVGLEPDPHKFPAHFPQAIDTAALAGWGQSLIEQTGDLVCCYKPNFAFYEQFGPAGLEALRQTIAAVPDDIPVLLDAKRGDIGSTAAAYARAAFEVWGVDAITVSPYQGQDSVTPFLAYAGKMAFVLCYTANPSAGEVQESGAPDERLFERIARKSRTWGDAAQIGLVVGVTQRHALARVRQIAGDRATWILAPGIGAQGSNLPGMLEAGLDQSGSGLIVPVSRGVIYAKNPRSAALTLRDRINRARQRIASRQNKLGAYSGKALAGTSPASPVAYPAPARADSFHADLILSLHAVGCIQFGQFTLASGKQSPVYIDLRRITASPALLQQVARTYADLLRPLTFNRLAAVPYAALTIGAAIALTVRRPLIYPRKEVKSYGTGRAIEGQFLPGEKVVIIEDLVTSAGSVLQAIETLEEARLAVSDVVVLIDRQQGGRENLARGGYRLHAVFGLSEVLQVLYEAGKISAEQVEAVGL